MNVFWRAKPLAAQQAKLLQLVLQAHEQCAMRDNISTMTVRNAAIGSGSFTNSVAAALLTVGGVHAPLHQAYALLATFNPDQMDDLARHIELGAKLPGWGSDFAKDGPDDAFRDIDALIAEHWPDLHARIARITDELHARGKMVWPNLALYTAACALVVDLPAPLIGWLFIQGRLSAWAREFFNTLAAHNAPRERKEVV